MRSALWRPALLALLALLALALASCAGEPAIVATIPPATPASVEAGYPSVPPDMANGAAIFAARCTECHGVTGAGDGTRVQSGQIQNVPNFLDPAVPGPQRVSDWYATITNGRIENLMPPWRNALSEQERWDVAYYTYTMHYSPEQLARGQVVFTENCARCHGENGQGDGPDAAELSGSVGDLTDQANMATLSDEAIFVTVSEGVGDPQDGMPSFAGELSEADRLAVVGYVRTLALANVPEFAAADAATEPAQQPTTVAQEATPAPATAVPTAAATVQPTTEPAQPIATEEPAASPVFTVSGTVTNGTAGGSVPAGLEVSLFVFPQGENPTELLATIDSENGYTFTDVPFAEDSAYAMTTEYRDRVFISEIVDGATLDASPTLDLAIYELTDDPSVITMTLVETQINVNSETNTLEIAQFMEFENTSDRAYTTTLTTPDGRPISLTIPLPPGAVVPGFNERSRYAYLSDEFTVVDTQLVLPNEIHLVQLVYLIPYEGSAILEQEVGYTFDGLAQLLVRPDGVQVKADGLASMGTTTVGGREFMSFSGTFTQPAGSVMRVELTGMGTGGPSSFQPGGAVVSSDWAALILLAGGVLVGVLIGVVIWTRRSPAPPEAPAVTAETLAKQIADLDAAHTAGKVPDDVWKQERARLKEQLTQLLMGGQK